MKKITDEQVEKLREITEKLPPLGEDETAPMILNDISHIFHGKMRSHEGEGIMTRNSARSIFRLLTREEGLLQGEIAKAIHVSAPTASLVLQEMENEGIICRKVNPMDMRSIRVYLTEAGKAHDEEFHAQLHRLDDAMMEGFTEAEIITLKSYLKRIRTNLLAEETALCPPDFNRKGEKKKGEPKEE